MQQNTEKTETGTSLMGRGSFLKYTGTAVVASTLLVQGCKKDDDDKKSVDLGSGDIGVLNYAYALEQLEAAFYTQVVSTPYSGITAAESQLMLEIKQHELIHRDFLKAALGANAIQNLEVDFSSIDFNSRASVLGAAKAFEDLGVAAYNGAGQLLQSADYLLLAGKIVSVEARHAAAIRSLLSPLSASFSGDDVVNVKGLDGASSPPSVLTTASVYIKTKINASNLPTS